MYLHRCSSWQGRSERKRRTITETLPSIPPSWALRRTLWDPTTLTCSTPRVSFSMASYSCAVSFQPRLVSPDIVLLSIYKHIVLGAARVNLQLWCSHTRETAIGASSWIAKCTFGDLSSSLRTAVTGGLIGRRCWLLCRSVRVADAGGQGRQQPPLHQHQAG